MTTALRREEELYSCMSSVLEDGIQYLRSPSDVASAIAAVLSLAQRATREFSERWNAHHSTIQLPPELLVECFRHLDMTRRLLVSAVCRHWRAVALAEPSLWSAFRLKGVEKPPRKLQEMLRRSGAVPLSIELDLEEDQEVLLREHLWRLRILVCDTRHYPLSLFSLPAPQLRELDYRPGPQYYRPDDVIADIPSSLAGGVARLRSLALPRFKLPPTCPALTDLREFRGSFDRAVQLTQLLALCPALVALTMKCREEMSADPSSVLCAALPPGLRSLKVHGTMFRALYYRGALQPWTRRAFRHLSLSYLDYYDPNSLLGVLEMFLRSHTEHWTMTIEEAKICAGSSFTFATTAADTTFEVILPSIPMAPEHVGNLFQQFGRLVSLTLPTHEFGIFVRSAVHVPVLAALTVVVYFKHEPAWDDWKASLDGAPGMVAPYLRALTVKSGFGGASHMLEWFFDLLPGSIRQWILYDAPVLESVSLQGRARPDLTKKIQKTEIPAMAKVLTLSLVAVPW
ncbi:hypothetical protein AURDEDRAFT_172001 [Auricularia subglabra TFB-10046 SS5]|nr:hypothetical protein AURDEDRAFT_172001 [Auricularia subglabra TFB-10046 SS5]